MTEPHICPVCKGEGKYKKKECHGCHGQGFVWPPNVWITDPPVIEHDPKRYEPFPGIFYLGGHIGC